MFPSVRDMLAVCPVQALDAVIMYESTYIMLVTS